MKTISFQFALFFNGTFDRPDQKYNQINERLNNIFDGIPGIVPIDQNTPLEFPYVQLRSTNGKYILNLSKIRADLLVTYGIQEITEGERKDFTIKCTNLMQELLSYIKYSRLGLVGNFIIEVKSPVEKLNNAFLKKDLSKATEIKIRYNYRKKWQNTEVNDVIDIQTITFNDNGRPLPAIQIQRDINTVPELQLNLGKKEVENYLNTFFNQLSEKELGGIIQ